MWHMWQARCDMKHVFRRYLLIEYIISSNRIYNIFYSQNPSQKKLNDVWLFLVFSLRNQIDVSKFSYYKPPDGMTYIIWGPYHKVLTINFGVPTWHIAPVNSEVHIHAGISAIIRHFPLFRQFRLQFPIFIWKWPSTDSYKGN